MTRLDVRLEQFAEPIGQLESTDRGAVAFAYDPAYAAHAEAMPISLALPLRPEPFDDPATRDFFDNLLPENDQLRAVMERERLSRDDVVGLLGRLGEDCPGAISCLPEGSPPQKIPGVVARDYDPLSRESLVEIARRLAHREAPLGGTRDPSPLAGVQRKIALTALGDGVFGLPKAGSKAPTTHILKAPPVARTRDAKLEQAAATLAGTVLDMDVAVPTCVDFDGVAAVIVARFDRVVADGVIYRVHQEDFAQALGLPASMKYERNGAGGRRFDAGAVASLLDRTAEPARAKRDFLLATLFNLLVGNTDNHAKNHALLYDRGPIPRFAPLYDLLPTLLDPAVNHELSFRIGDAVQGDDVARADIERLLATFGLGAAAQRRFMDRDVRALVTKLEAESAALTEAGLKDLDDLIGRQLGRMNDAFGLGVQLRPRDYFAPRGGGWGLGS